ncbi:MAG: isoprenyl transferase [Bacteroidales bacterium]
MPDSEKFEQLRSAIDPARLPRHVAIIMDGNGRWARQRGMERIKGHQHAVTAVREAAEAAAELGIRYLTLYTFSTENWKRPQCEVEALMKLLVETLNTEMETLSKNNIRLRAIGDLGKLQPLTRQALEAAIEATAHFTHMDLVLALSYSSRWEIRSMVREIARKAKEGSLDPENINDSVIQAHLNSYFLPDPELLIRTSGEFRISNFLLWQLAYTELWFTPKLWPDFRKEDLAEAVLSYQQRERRFGQTSEQIRENLPQ